MAPWLLFDLTKRQLKTNLHGIGSNKTEDLCFLQTWWKTFLFFCLNESHSIVLFARPTRWAEHGACSRHFLTLKLTNLMCWKQFNKAIQVNSLAVAWSEGQMHTVYFLDLTHYKAHWKTSFHFKNDSEYLFYWLILVVFKAILRRCLNVSLFSFWVLQTRLGFCKYTNRANM